MPVEVEIKCYKFFKGDNEMLIIKFSIIIFFKA